ncbi:zinc ribbon domain-containing protein [uncultured Corynebacterium sp.]|uniref:zinc ribbon domain-containing protein n=1 Tax=uncultured Corynebacterium sp. TaxID=159447 RepID=UPI0025DD0379|nr:C4-type zinc ribbon domain-containing protein [uncultured Corynebacterium sp.]
MKCTAKDRQALLTLARDSEQESILEARLDSLPERHRVEELEADLRENREREVRNRANYREHRASEHRLRQDIAKLRARAKANTDALSAETDREKRKDLQHDLRSTRVRLEALENQLDRAERVAEFFSQEGTEGVGTELRQAREELRRAENAVNADLEAVKARITQAKEDLDPEILAAYECQLEDHGIGVAELKGVTCQGCFMELDPMTMKEFRSAPATQLLRCPECNVFLVRPTGS